MLQKGLLFIGSLRFPVYSLGPGVLCAHGCGAACQALILCFLTSSPRARELRLLRRLRLSR